MPTITEEINRPDGYRYFDESEMIDYLFIGFPQPLTTSERVGLIRDHGSPRKTPKNREYENKDIKIIIEEAASAIETQMILHSQDDNSDRTASGPSNQ